MREILKLPEGAQGRLWAHVGARSRHFMHCHEELEVNLVYAGRAACLVKDRRYELTPGSLLWLFPDQEHLLIEQSADFAMWILVFRPTLLRRVCREPANRILRQRDPEGDFFGQLLDADFRVLCRLLAELANEPAGSDRLNAGLGYLVLEGWRLHQRAGHAIPTRRVHPAVEQAAKLLHADPCAFDLSLLAQKVGLSASRLSRLFGRQMGLNLVDYRQRRLVERFLELFARHPHRKLASLALQAGFGSYPQFHRVFRKLMGRSPADFLRHPD